MASQDDRQDLLMNATEGGRPPQRRLTSGQAAYDLYIEMKRAGEGRAIQWARIQGMYDRNPPFNQADLDRLGRGDQTNVNTGEMESIIDSNAAAAHEAIFEVPQLIAVRIQREYLTDNRAVDYPGIIAEEYTETLHEWPAFTNYTDQATKDSFRFGMGFMLWRDEWDWRPRAFRAGNFLCPARASTSFGELEIFGVRDEIPVRHIYEAVSNEEVAKASGWNLGFTRKFIADTYEFKATPDDESQTSDWESIQTKIRTNDYETEKQDFRGIRVVHLLVREVSTGFVSHFIIPEEYHEKDFLFKSYNRFDDMYQVLWLLLYDNGDGMLRSVKGLGHRAFMHCDLSNRLFCTTIDGGKLSASLVVQPRAGADISKAQILRTGMLTMVPSTLDVLPTAFQPPIQHLIPLRQMSSDILNNNVGIARPRSENPLAREAEKTAAQVQLEEAKEAKFSKNQAAQRYVQWDRWHREVFRRLTYIPYLANGYASIVQLVQIIQGTRGLAAVYAAKEGAQDFLPGQKEAIAFLAGCVRRGVPAELVLDPDALNIRATRAVGLGSESGKRLALQQLMGARGAMDEFSRRNVERDWTAAIAGGYAMVDRYFPPIDRSKVPSSEASFAALENSHISRGDQVIVGVDQMHAEHIPVHFSPLIRLAGAYRQNPNSVDATRAVQLFKAMIPHIQQHLRHLATDATREEQVKQYVETLKALVGVFKQLQSQAQQVMAAQDAQAQAQQAEVEDLRRRADENEVKLAAERYRIDKQMELEKLDVASLHASRMAKTETSNAAKLAQLEANIAALQRKTDAEIALEQQKANAQ